MPSCSITTRLLRRVSTPRLHQFQPKRRRHGLEIREIHIAPLFDVADSSLVGKKEILSRNFLHETQSRYLDQSVQRSDW